MPNSPRVSTPPAPETDSPSTDPEFGPTIVQEGDEYGVEWTEATFLEAEVEKGTDNTLLLKSQADQRYGALSGGEIGTLQIDASTQDQTKKLPLPTADTVVVVHRIDNNSSTTATIESPNPNDIYWPGRAPSPSFDLFERQVLVLSADGANWTVENPAVYEIEATNAGGFQADTVVLRHVARHDIELVDIRIDADTGPGGQMDFILEVLDVSKTVIYTQTIAVTSAQTTASIGQLVQENYVARIKTDTTAGNFDGTMADASLNIDAIRA